MKLSVPYSFQISSVNYALATSLISGSLIYANDHILAITTAFNPATPATGQAFAYVVSVTPDRVGKCYFLLNVETKTRIVKRFCSQLGLSEIFSENFLLTEDEVSENLIAWIAFLDEFLETSCGVLYSIMTEAERNKYEYILIGELSSVENFAAPKNGISAATYGIKKISSDTESLEFKSDSVGLYIVTSDDIIAERIVKAFCGDVSFADIYTPIILVGSRRTEESEDGETADPVTGGRSGDEATTSTEEGAP